MFVIELTAGLLGNSVSLVADSLDMLGDALVYGFSLYVVALGAVMKAKAALLKGAIMAAFGFFVLGQAIYRIALPQLPVYEAIGAIGLLALAANSTCFFLLWRHRADDINMSSVWLNKLNATARRPGCWPAAMMPSPHQWAAPCLRRVKR